MPVIIGWSSYRGRNLYGEWIIAKLCLWDVEPRSYHKQSASQVGALLQKSAPKHHFMFHSFGENTHWSMRMWQLCRPQQVITTVALKRMRYRGSILNLHPLAACFHCPLIHDTATSRRTFVFLDKRYKKRRSVCISTRPKAITVNLYTFHTDMFPIRAIPRRADKMSSVHVEHLRSEQTPASCFALLIPIAVHRSAVLWRVQ